ncbi:unnamed protein product (macronuclear) [Paramecium tetraurelia]|uniref:Uncharacterized protein n=1 Tax=Paramecium tetraurelia TaxID=5888 RepID=A0DJC1_PARTE|nr:uncharacterized protein GSPATT00017482001 [Paramecium tetraurelia]CAK83138.1 unnamed protein product [Paramecium tetraurelia]|eukprot:XP_001450535.1 hypothetical protein (macronuclear) [Paramecium tetraurelia strain d4-2]
MKHIDQLKEYYGQQQLIFEKDLDQMRNHLSRVDNVRLKAEKELLYLQSKAKEQKVWDIVDQTPFLPVIEGDRIFKTTKFVNSNLTEAEKRQLLLQEYYRNDKARNAIRQLYNTNNQYEDDQTVPELYTETQLILPKIHAQTTQVFDESLLRDLQSMKNREDEITKRLQANEITQIKNPSDYQRMLENQTILPILQSMKNEGQRSIVTPMENHQQVESAQKKLRSEGDSAQITFVNEYEPQNQQMQNTQQQFELDFTGEHQRTEELLLNESEIPKAQDQMFEYEEQQSFQEPQDPIDEKIDELLTNIQQIVTHQYQPHQSIQKTNNALQTTWKLAIEKDQIAPKQRPKDFKPVNFLKKPIVQQEQILYKPLVQTQQVQKPLPDDNFERLDRLIQHLEI